MTDIAALVLAAGIVMWVAVVLPLVGLAVAIPVGWPDPRRMAAKLTPEPAA